MCVTPLLLRYPPTVNIDRLCNNWAHWEFLAQDVTTHMGLELLSVAQPTSVHLPDSSQMAVTNQCTLPQTVEINHQFKADLHFPPSRRISTISGSVLHAVAQPPHCHFPPTLCPPLAVEPITSSPPSWITAASDTQSSPRPGLPNTHRSPRVVPDPLCQSHLQSCSQANELLAVLRHSALGQWQ